MQTKVTQDFSRKSNRYNSSTVVLPSVGARINWRKDQILPYFISPHDRRYRAWQNFLIVLTLYTAWISLFEFGFSDKASGSLFIVDYVVNGFFAIDIVLTACFVAYLDTRYNLVYNRKQIVRKYLKSWLLIDIFSILASELSWLFGKYSFLCNILRLSQLRRLGPFFTRLEKDTRFHYYWVRCGKLIFVILFHVHCAGCIFYRVAALYHDQRKTWIGALIEDFPHPSLWTRYVMSLYWSISTFTTVGYGDVHAENTGEMLFCSVYMLLNFGLSVYLIGNMSEVLVRTSSSTRQLRSLIEAATRFAKRNQFPNDLRDLILSNLSLKLQTNSEAVQQQEVLDSLPEAIRSCISCFLFEPFINKVYLFQRVSNDLLSKLVSEMEAKYFLPQKDVIIQNQEPTDLYILISGAVDFIVLNDGVEEVIGSAKPGDLCGEIGVLCHKPYLFTVRTSSLSQLLRLRGSQLISAVESTVGDRSKLMNNFLEHFSQLMEHPMMKGVLHETEEMISQGITDLPLTLCFAAHRGDYRLLLDLLEKGINPNEPDSNQRTALHIASSKGNEECVKLLLQYDADPHCRDSRGSVPLWEALLGNHKEIIQLFSDIDAQLNTGDVGLFSLEAAKHNNLTLLNQIIDFGGDVNLPHDGSTALHAAVWDGNIEVVKFLLEQGASIYTTNKEGLTALDLANQQRRVSIQNLFESYILKFQGFD